MANLLIGGRPDGVPIMGSTERNATAAFTELVHVGDAALFVTPGAARYLEEAQRAGAKFSLSHEPSSLMSLLTSPQADAMRSYGQDNKQGWAYKSLQKY